MQLALRTVAAALAMHGAPAEPPSAATALRWDAPPACPNEPEILASVETILGAPLGRPRARPLSILGVIQTTDTSYSLRIFTVDAGGLHERALRYDRSCALLGRAAAVLIAITIDPTAVARLDEQTLALLEAPAPDPSPPEPAPSIPVATPVNPVESPTPVALPTSPSTSPSISPSPAPSTAPPPRPRIRPGGAVRLTGGLGLGDLPAAGGGLGGALSLVFDRLRLEAVVGWWPGRRVRIVASPDAGANFRLWTLGARACGVLHPHRRVEVPLCGGFEGGQIHVTKVRLADDQPARTTWLAVVVAPAVAYLPRRWFALWFAADLAVPLVRTSFQVEGAGEIYRPRPVAGRFSAGVELRFP